MGEPGAREDQLAILVIDDDDVDRLRIQRLLGQLPAPPRALDVAVDCATGKQLLAERRHDLVLLDFRLPDGTALDLLTWLRELGGVRPAVIVQTVHDDDALAVETLGRGAQDYLVKGRFDAGGLRRAIRYALERHRLVDALDASLTALRTAQRQLAVADRLIAINTLTSGLAHEVNNPLAAVVTNVGMIVEDLRAARAASPGPALDELVTMAEDAAGGADRVADIIARLQLVSGAKVEHRQTLDLGRVVADAIELIGSHLDDRVTVVSRLTPGLAVVADEGRLVQVFFNILLNAIHAIPADAGGGQVITVTTSLGAGVAIVAIVDPGRGMSDDELRQAFDPFYTTRGIGRGLGLGLSICHGVVTALGGTIEVASVVGEGTTVRVALPVVTSAVTPAAAAAGSSAT
jgi:signal transduction histidine kinase